jgi:1-acyl-sn-glycerol-3-phosphate acyltransferase
MDLIYMIVCGFYKLIGKLWLRLEVKLVGIDELPSKGPLIIAPNHASYLDPTMLSGVWWPKKLDFFASNHLFKSHVIGWFLRHLRTHPLVRENGMQALRQALRILAQNKAIVIFPEGTRSRSGTMGALKKGIAMLSCKANCPVVPVFISGAYDVWPPERKFPRLFHKQKVYFYVGKPLPPCSEGEEGYSDWLTRLRTAYSDLEKEASLYTANH